MSAQIDRVTASTRNRFSGVLLDRLVHRREDLDWQNRQLSKAQTRLVPMWRNRCLLRHGHEDTIEAILVSPTELSELVTIREPTLLGSDGNLNYFALTINDKQRDELLDLYPDGEFQDLRLAAAGMIGPEAGILAYAKALHYWQHRHTFCGVCGYANRLLSGGHRMVCTNEECQRETFPRIDPAIIVLVTHDGACLLGRGAGWPKNRYSTLAGFVEPGESLEDAVVREVFEEAGIRLKSMRYRSSQPWPFPASAMAGFYAEAETSEVTTDDELEDARWFTPDDIRRELEANRLRLSPRLSIAFRLISDWYTEQTGESLISLIDELKQKARQT
jgi:NAD+ diphosphatase